MKQSHELRVGNIIELSTLDDSIVKEVPVNQQQLIGIWKGEFKWKGIELTPRWLERIGLSTHLANIGLDEGYVNCIERQGNELWFIDSYQGNRILQFKYLHKVQNFYYEHTDKELEIEQFAISD